MASEVQGSAVAGFPQEGATVGGYLLLRAIDDAGSWRTFDARRIEDEAPVTLRIILGSAVAGGGIHERFQTLMAQLQTVASAGIETVQEVNQLPNGNWVIVSSVREGQTFADRLRRSGPIPTGELATMVPKVIALIAAASAAGIQGVIATPASLRLLPDGSLRLSDAGLAHLLRAQGCGFDDLEEVIYAAPELLRRDAPTTASQVYAVGVLVTELLSATLPSATFDLERAKALKVGTGAAIPIVPQVGRLPVAAVIRQACAPDPARRFASLRELEGNLVGALMRPPDPPPVRRLTTEILFSLLVTAITGVITGLVTPYVPGACERLASATDGTPVARLSTLICGEPPAAPILPTIDAAAESRRAFAGIRPRVFACVMEEMERRQQAEGSAAAEALLPQLAAADAPAAEAARSGSGNGNAGGSDEGSVEGSGLGSGSGAGQGSGSGANIVAPPSGLKGGSAAGDPQVVAEPVALVARPVQPPPGSPAAASVSLAEVRRSLGHVEILALVGDDGLARELVIPDARLSEDGRACVAVAASGLHFPPLLSGQPLLQSFWLFGASAPTGLPDDLDDATLLHAIENSDAEAGARLAECLSAQGGMGSGGALQVEGRFWVAASGQSNLFELDPARFPAQFRTCAAGVFHDLAIPATERLHAVTLAWNCSTGSKALCAREATRPPATSRSNPTF